MFRRTKKLSGMLMRINWFFVLILGLLLTVGIIYMTYQIIDSIERVEKTLSSADKIVRPDYTEISIGDFKKIESWIEILDENKQVVYVIGTPLEQKSSYTEEELFRAMSNSPEKQNFFYSMAPFQTKDGKSYLCVLKTPMKSRSIEVYIFDLLPSLLAYLVFIVVVVYLLSRWTARKISKPLKKIAMGIEKMTQGDYDTSIRFEAEEEFAQIRDAFNYMAEKISGTEKIKREAEENKQRLLADIAHDIKTPHSTISGYARALAEGMVSDREKQLRYLQTICEKSERVNVLIESLLDLSQLDAAAHSFNFEESDFCEFLREMISEHYEEIEEKEFSLEIILPDRFIFFMFDRQQMGRVLANLLSNALKYNQKGTHLRIALEEMENELVLEVANSGNPIPDRLKDVIFEPFVRGDEARGTTGGMGLGLAIAQKIVERHRGTIRLLEMNKECTNFIITLPRK